MKKFISFFLALFLICGTNVNIITFAVENIDTVACVNENKKIIQVPYINQDNIVSGCEGVSATMILQYYGYQISAEDFIDKNLIRKDWSVKNGIINAADPNSAYPGDPYIASGYNCGFGCYAPVIAESMNKILNPQTHVAIITTGTSLSVLKNYIDHDIPVLIWATMNMQPAKQGSKWIIDYIDENSMYKVGDKFTWIAGEHCLVLVGYDENNYYFNDPYKNHGLISYNKDIVEERFKELGSQSVIVLKK